MPRELGRGDINKDAARLRVLLASGGATTHSHADYVRIATADVITAVHTFNPATATPFIILGANAAGQLITGLNADLLDGNHYSQVATDIATAIATHTADPDAHQALVTLSTDLGNNLLGLTGQELTLDTQAANLIFAGPSSGGATAPTFRALVEGDLPATMATDAEVTAAIAAHAALPNAHHNQSHVLATTSALGADHTVSGLTARQFLVATGATTALFRIIEDADIPSTIARDSELHSAVTLSTALNSNLLSLSAQELGLDTQTANFVFAGPTSGAAAVPSFRAAVVADLPAGSAQYQFLMTGATPFAPAYTAVSTLAGAGMTATAGVLNVITADTSMTINADSIQVRLATTSGLTISTGLMVADTIAGNGLTIASKVLAVGAGTLISVAADAVALANGSAQYQIPVTGATPFTPAYTALSTFAGAGLVFSGGVYAVGVSGLGLSTTADAVVLTSSSGPGAAASILATDATGAVAVQSILTPAIYGLSSAVTITPTPGSNLNIALSGTGDLVVNTDDLVVDTSAGNVSMAGLVTAGNLLSTGYVGSYSAIPYFRGYETGAGVDQKYFEVMQTAGQVYMRFVNDAYSASSNFMTVARSSGTYTVDNVTFPTGSINITNALNVGGDLTITTNGNQGDRFTITNSNVSGGVVFYDFNQTDRDSGSTGAFELGFYRDANNLTQMRLSKEVLEVIIESGGTYHFPLEVRATQVIMAELPTSDPGIAGALWRSGTDVMVSV